MQEPSFFGGTMAGNLSTAISAFQQGRLGDAISGCEQVLQQDPLNAGALNLLGIARSSAGQHDVGAELMRRSVEIAPGVLEYRKNYVKALMLLQRLDEAAAVLRDTIKLQPESADLLALWGAVVGQQGKLEEGIAALQRAIMFAPNVPAYRFNLAELHRRNRDRPAAQHALEETLRLSPNHTDALNNLAGMQLNEGNFVEALQSIQRLLKIDPRSAQAYLNLGTLFAAAGDSRSAAKALRNVLLLDPNLLRARLQLADVLAQEGDLEEAEQLIAGLRSGEDTESAAIKTTHARILERKGDIQGALEIVESIVQKHPIDVNLALVQAILLEQLGKPTEALAVLQQTLANNEVAALEGIGINFTLGQLHDALGNYDAAFAAYWTGNENRKKAFIRVDGEVQGVTSLSDEIVALHEKNGFNSLPLSTLESDIPIFIVGMPRSGSSLIEQILASHSKVFGAGELSTLSDIVRGTYGSTEQNEAPLQIIGSDPSEAMHRMIPRDWGMITSRELNRIGEEYLAFIQKLNPDARRITDKMPYNYFLAPVIAKVFPRAKIIHCKRHPLDNCLSCYFTNFTLGSQFTFDLAELGGVYRKYVQMMSYWRDALEIPMLDVQYEELVREPESNVKRLLDFCELEWEPKCMSFYKSKRIISTASYQQVRQPIYTKSVGRWTNYIQHLAPLVDALQLDQSTLMSNDVGATNQL